MKLLLVDDEAAICRALANFLKKAGDYEVQQSNSGAEALEIIKSQDFDILITDISMPGIDGFELASFASQLKKEMKIILISGNENIIESINSMDNGVTDFLTKPVNTAQLLDIIQKIRQEKSINGQNESAVIRGNTSGLQLKRQTESQRNAKVSFNHKYLIAASPAMKSILQKLDKLREYPEIPALLEGNTGTGKEIIAQYLHYGLEESNKPFIGINCGAIPSNLFEAELFGYDKGAFTGADPKGKEGKIKLAEGGTLFLDEISEISLELQVKLLRVIQEMEYYKVGGTNQYQVKARIVCATNKSIPELIEKALFREDLYHRLNVCAIKIPPLNQRVEDIELMVFHFMEAFNAQNKTGINEIRQEALNYLKHYDWPGNVRELKNAVYKAMLFNDKPFLSLEDFNFLNAQKKAASQVIINTDMDIALDKPFSLEEFENKIIKAALNRFNNNKSKAAEFLGLNRTQLYYRYKIDEPVKE